MIELLYSSRLYSAVLYYEVCSVIDQRIEAYLYLFDRKYSPKSKFVKAYSKDQVREVHY